VGDPWLSITLTLCHILHSVSHWPVLVYYFNAAGHAVGPPFIQGSATVMQTLALKAFALGPPPYCIPSVIGLC
jgi:hypothetical protein